MNDRRRPPGSSSSASSSASPSASRDANGPGRPRGRRGESRERVYRYVRERILAGEPPTVREVQNACGFKAVESARSHLRALVDAGRLLHEEGMSRGYRLPGRRGGIFREIPILGRVQAGALTTAVEDLDGYLPVQSPHEEDLFALRVRGESMRDAGILPDDVVIVRRQPTAESGEVVVAVVEDEATVKRLKYRGRHVELHPENPEFLPIRVEPDAVVILGKVVEVRRYLD